MIKAAVIGTGYLGSFHAEKYYKLQDVDLVAVCDVDPTRAKKLAKQLSCEAYSDFRELEKLDLDCVSIASGTRTHYEIAAYFLENGVDVLVEKPMTTTIEEARHLIKLAEQGGRIIQVGHLERFNPVLKKLREYLHNPWFFEVRRIAPFKGRGADVDVVLDLMIHDIDLLLYLVDRPVIKVEAMGIPVLTSSIDIANARLEFEGGAVANVSTSRAAFQSERTIRVFQPDKYISIDLEKKKIKVAEKGEGKSLLGVPNINQTEEKFDMRDALQDQITAFVECVLTRNTPLASGHDGLKALEMVALIKQSMREVASRFGSLPQEVSTALSKY